MTSAQTKLYWREWSAVRRRLLASGTYTPAEADAERHRAHLQALGADKSSKDLTSRDLDALLDHFRLLASDTLPGPESGARRRLLQSIGRILHGKESYYQKLAESMALPRDWRRLSDTDLQKLRTTLEHRLVRKKPAPAAPAAPAEAEFDEIPF